MAHKTPGDRLQELEEKAHQQPNSPQVSFELAEQLWRSSDLERCKAMLLDMQGSPPPGWNWLKGAVQEAEGNFSLAEGFFRKELMLPNSRKEAYSALGRVLEIQGHFRDAGDAFIKSARQNRNPDDFLMSAKMAERIGKPSLAEERLQEGLSLIGPAVVLRFARVKILVSMGDLVAAQKEIDALLLLAPKHTKWLKVRAQILSDIRTE
jgi:tetratricopeptide (TPR) repeat protein